MSEPRPATRIRELGVTPIHITREPHTRHPRHAPNVKVQTQIGRRELALVKEFAHGNRFTIRSVIEAACIEYLECRGVPIPEPEPVQPGPEPVPKAKLHVVEATRDGGETWKPVEVLDRIERDGTVFVMGTDHITYQREGGDMRTPFRWRWARMVATQTHATKGAFYGNAHVRAEATDLAPPNELLSRREELGMSERQCAKKSGIHQYVYRGLETQLISPLRTQFVCRHPECEERAYPALGFMCDAHSNAEAHPLKQTWTAAALKLAAFHETTPSELFPSAGLPYDAS